MQDLPQKYINTCLESVSSVSLLTITIGSCDIFERIGIESVTVYRLHLLM